MPYMGEITENASARPRKRVPRRTASTGAGEPSKDEASETPALGRQPKGSGRHGHETVQQEPLPLALPAVGGGVPKPASHRLLSGRHPRPTGRGRTRESNITGLVERSRLLLEDRPLLPMPDLLLSVLPGLRRVLLHYTLEEVATLLTDTLVATLGPSVAQLWIVDPTPWGSEPEKAGGREVTPLMRARSQSCAMQRVAIDLASWSAVTGESMAAAEIARAIFGGVEGKERLQLQQRPPSRASALISEVATGRRPVVLFDADTHPLADGWSDLLPARPATGEASNTSLPASESSSSASSTFGTLAAYPLYARGQLLGVLAVATGMRLGPRHLAALEDMSSLAGLAADRDRLLSYSRSQEALAQTVVRHAPVAIAVLTGEEHALALSNPAFATLLGLELQGTLTGQRLGDLLPPDRASSVAASLRLDAVYQSGEPQAMIELPIHHSARGMTYWNVTSSPLSPISASVGGVLVAAVEVTRQVVSRQRALDSAEMAQDRIGQMMTLHATSLAVASQLGADPRELLADILRRSIALLNARAGAVYVLDPRFDELEVIVCQGLRGDYTGARIRVGDGLAGRVGETGQGLIVDDYRAYPYRTAIYDGEDFSAVIAVPLIHRGQVVGVLDVLDDAERRAFTDDDLWLLDLFAAQAAQAIENARTYVELERAYRKQRELDRMKDDFIATASHELRTPLTGVSGFLDLLLEYPGSRDEPLAVEFLEKASESAQELAEIAERLLQTSRLDTGRMEIHTGPVRLATVIEEVLHSYKGLQQSQGSHYDLSAEIAPEVYVEADLGRLKEVLDNLMSNAIKYSPHGGRIEVTREVSAPATGGAYRAEERSLVSGSIDERPTLVMPHLVTGATGEEESSRAPSATVIAAGLLKEYITVVVRDHGMGIPVSEQGNLFRRFSRLESARASQIRGTGLGLYICRQIMRAMDGDVWLQESTPGEGSAFAFTLPAAEAKEDKLLPLKTATSVGRLAAND
jgi:signal transduction histidine kinase